MRKLVRGFGINDAGYKVTKNETINGRSRQTWMCPFYRAWTGMIERCYSEKFHSRWPRYIGCEVSESWRLFSDFKAWMKDQAWEGLQLDKDILVPGNKIYSPETCAFVSGPVNSFVNDCSAGQGQFAVGVCWHQRDKRFRAQCRNPFTGSIELIGSFRFELEAHEAWRKRKHELSCAYADTQTDERVAIALRTRFLPSKKEEML